MKAVTIQTTVRKFFHFWLEVTKRGHGLGGSEAAVLAELLYYKYELEKVVTEPKIVNKLLFSYDVKEKIKKTLDYKTTTFNSVLTRLRKKKAIINKNSIDPKFDPGIKPGDEQFILAYKFKLVNNGHQKEDSKKIQKNSK